MKKSTSFKKYGLTFTALFVCLAIIATCFTFLIPLRSAYRASATVPSSEDSVSLLGESDTAGLKIPETCDFGYPIVIPASPKSGVTVKIEAPNGKDVTPALANGAYTVTASQVGNYVVTYSYGNASQTFNVYVTLEKEYFLRVKDNGATIKSNMNKDETFKVPAAEVKYYDENNILKNYEGNDVSFEIVDSYGNSYDPADNDHNTFVAKAYGKASLTYTAFIGNKGKAFTQTFTVNVTSTYNDGANPQLTVSGVSSSISVNRAVTLPKATATDDYDTNVKIDISVVDPDGNPVKVTEVNRYGYAEKPAEGAANVEFDNDKAMTFYPVKEGQYKVTYVATDDAGKTSATKVFTPVASDSYAPVFEEIDESAIPANWGINVKNIAGATTAGGKITLPIPTLVDNKDHMPDPDNAEDKNDLIKLYVRVTDSDRSLNFVEFKNVLGTGDDCKFTPNGTYGKSGDDAIVFDQKNAFTLDLSKYNRKAADGTETDDKTGTYTVYYRAEDQAGNRSTKSFTVNVTADYTDAFAPNIAEITVPKYLSTGSDTLTVPSPVVTDTYGEAAATPQISSNAINIDYRLYSTVDSSYLKVKGGEKAEFVTVKENNADVLYLVINKDKAWEEKIKVGDKLYLYVKATDSAGNVTYYAEDTADSDYKNTKAVITVINDSAAGEAVYTPAIDLKIVDENGDLSDGTIRTDDKVNAGGFTIETSSGMRNYTGFEVSVTDVDGNVVNTSLETYTVYDAENPATKAKIYVRNITFVPGTAGVHYLNIRVFDVNNNNWAYCYKVNVEEESHGGGTVVPQAVVVPTNGSVNVKYTLHETTKTEFGDVDETYYIARQIKGGVYSLMGNEFTAKSQGSYSVTDGFVAASKKDSYAKFSEDFEVDGNDGGAYSFSITDTEAPVIEIQGAMPLYVAEASDTTPIKLPVIFAYSKNGNADVEVTVKYNKDGKDIDVGFDDATRQYSFKGAKDGAYTVTVTATRAKATPATATYTVNVGKVTPPQFSVNSALTIKMQQGKEFTYADIVLGTGEPADGKGIKITKKILDPSKEEVSGATVSGTWNSNHAKTNNGTKIYFDKSGTYNVYYYAEDELGNGADTPIIVKVEVSASGSSSPTTFTTLSTVLIIIAVVLLAGVIVYVVRFRKVKK